jgi:hypothetical protein
MLAGEPSGAKVLKSVPFVSTSALKFLKEPDTFEIIKCLILKPNVLCVGSISHFVRVIVLLFIDAKLH